MENVFGSSFQLCNNMTLAELYWPVGWEVPVFNHPSETFSMKRLCDRLDGTCTKHALFRFWQGWGLKV